MNNKIDLIILGTGNVGKELVNTIIKSYSNSVNIVLISNSKTHILSHEGLKSETLENFISKTNLGTNIISNDIIKETISKLNFTNVVAIDVSASEQTANILLFIKQKGGKIVLANKKPLVQKLSNFKNLTSPEIGASATVGTRIPILQTIRSNNLTIETVPEFSGCFSGSIGFIIEKMEQGMLFSEAIFEAHKNGFTEPDPRDDLSGTDIGRKALIVARFLGAKLEMDDVEIKPLFPNKLKGIALNNFFEEIEEENEKYVNLFTQAKSKGMKVRYTGSFKNNKCLVSLCLTESNSYLGTIKGSEKIIVFKDKNQKEIVVKATEPGAGAKSTVKDIINDIKFITNQNI
ncbi:MAG: hypothetical protein JXA53_08820 [Bacteroidales bacterium]|nr:hypothetical protein [Bacteroidales bacterium]